MKAARLRRSFYYVERRSSCPEGRHTVGLNAASFNVLGFRLVQGLAQTGLRRAVKPAWASVSVQDILDNGFCTGTLRQGK